MSQLWLDVLDTSGNKLGYGPIRNIQSVTARRVLDGAGNFRITLPGTDWLANEVLLQERQVRVHWLDRDPADHSTAQSVVLLQGIIRQVTRQEDEGGWLLVLEGPDVLAALKQRNTFRNRTYNTDTHPTGDKWTLGEIAADLVSLVPGWSVQVESAVAGRELQARFDGLSVWKALLQLASDAGLHLRVGYDSVTGGAAQVVELGAFGDDIDLTLTQRSSYTADGAQQGSLAAIERIAIREDSRELVNRVLPLGAGDGDTRLTLAQAVNLIDFPASDPYAISVETINGQAEYLLEDSTSVAQYGPREKTLLFDQIQIPSNNTADIETGSRALYDAAAAYLDRSKSPQTLYEISLRELYRAGAAYPAPGDQVRLFYRGSVEQQRPDGTTVTVPNLALNKLVWVLATTVTVERDGYALALQLSDVDRPEQSIERVIVGELEKARLGNLVVKASTSHYVSPFADELDNTHPARIDLWFDERTLRLRQVQMRIITRPFRSTAQAAAAGGGSTETTSSNQHQHLILRANDATPDQGSYTTRRFSIVEQGTGQIYHFLAGSDVGSSPRFFDMQPSGNHTHTVDVPQHTHPLSYGIFEDTEYPRLVQIRINGTLRSTELGGPWVTGAPEPLDVTVDITPFLEQEPTIQKLHTIEIECFGGRGKVFGLVNVYEDIQNIV